MPKFSKYARFFKCKVYRQMRKDGEYRYRVNLPKKLIESDKNGVLLYGTFELDPLLRTIIFYQEEKK